MEIHPSARKHAIPDEDIRHAVRHYLFVADVGADPSNRVLYLGPDRAGNLLEVVAIERADDVTLAIHAMKMRARFRQFLPRAGGQR